MKQSQTIPRTLDPRLPVQNNDTNIHNNIDKSNKETSLFDKLNTLHRCNLIPANATTLPQCALHEIKDLIQVSSSKTHLMTPEEEDSLDDGFVICDLAVIQRKLKVWKNLFPRIKPFYALKCNPDPMVAAVLGYHSKEVGFDCASPSEIRLALSSSSLFSSNEEKNDFNDSTSHALRCIYANPQRAHSDLEQALDLNVKALAFDGEEELWKVKAAYDRRMKVWNDELLGSEANGQHYNIEPPLPPEMILRLLVPDEHSSIPLGEKFGANPDLIKPLVELACELHLPIIGISFHCGSGCHDPNAYRTAIQLAHDAMNIVNEVLQLYNMDPCILLDIGGGYPGVDGAGADLGRFSGCEYNNPESIEKSPVENTDQNSVCGSSPTNNEDTAADIANVVTPFINRLFPADATNYVHIMSEPGRYFVEEAFAVCSRIYSTQIVEDVRHYYIAQGVHGVFKDVLLCGENFVPLGLSMQTEEDKSDNLQKKKLFRSVVHGPSGEDFDIVNPNCLLPSLKEEDWLIFDRMGAYTLSIAARSGKLPIRYVVGGGGFFKS